MRIIIVAALGLALCACSPDFRGLEAGETGMVATAEGPDRVRLEGGLLVFLSGVQPPEGEADERSAQAALAALTEGRRVRLAYDARRRVALRDGSQAALAHVFAQSESGGWTWVQAALVAQGLTVVRPRPGEAAQAPALLAAEAEARAAGLGVWANPRAQPRSVALFTLEAEQLDQGCGRGPFRLLEGVVDHVGAGSAGMYLNFGPPGTEQEDATARIRDRDLDAWRAAGVDLPGLAGASVRVRGPAGYGGGPLLCLEHPAGLEVLAPG